MLNEAELVEINNRLQTPIIINNIIHGHKTFDDDTQFALHTILSDFEPDSALLAIALSVSPVSNIYKNNSTSMRILHRECEKIISDYADLWLQNAKGTAIDENEALDVLENTADDLEGLATLIKLAIPFLQIKDETAAKLFQILRIQANAQSLIAETLLETLGKELHNKPLPVEAIKMLNTANNVIAFPGLHMNQTQNSSRIMP